MLVGGSVEIEHSTLNDIRFFGGHFRPPFYPEIGHHVLMARSPTESISPLIDNRIYHRWSHTVILQY